MQVLEFFPDVIEKSWREGDKLFLKTLNKVILCVQVITDDIIRFRFGTYGHFQKDFSYAIDPNFEGGYQQFDVEETASEFILTTNTLICTINKVRLSTKITDKNGLILCEDEKGFHWEDSTEEGGSVVQISKKVQDGEYYYGLGDKPMHLNLRGKRIQNWGTDEYGFPKDKDPIYKNIPFYIGMHHQIGYGIFFDNTFQSFFDFASERRSATSFWAQGGEMNYYFIYGPNMIEVVEKYTFLTGTPEMPPLWSLGYHQCKWSYYPESQVRDIAQKFRDLQIPCDAIYLDIDYMDGFRCFTWDKERFPAPKKMVDDLKAQGFKTIVIIDPGIKIDEDYWVCQEGFEKGYFCKRADGPLLRGKVWPGDCYFPDFTNPEVREWWSGLFKEIIADIGVKGVWNDMNEPALFEVPSKTFPLDVRHDYDGNNCSHRKAHNIYGMQMARATQMGVKKFAYPHRPFIITRSAYSGAQRFTSGWTGDNIATWEHLWVANMQCQRMSISGFSFIGSDIGGFIEHPSPELYIRWIQLGIFHPFCRTHSSGDHGDQEPWTFGDLAIKIVRKFINLRYQLLPYFYTVFWQYVNEATPMLRPIAFLDQADKETHHRADEFCLGNNILVCPIITPDVRGRRMYFPRGRWYNFWTDELMEGGREERVDAPLDQIPMYIKEGAALPMYPVMQYVGEKEVNELTLHIYYKNGEHVSPLYEDAGDGYSYKKGNYSLKQFKVLGTKKVISLVQLKTGKYKAPYKTTKLVLHGVPFHISTCKVDKTEIDIKQVLHNKTNNTYTITVDSNFAEVYFRTSY